ncbi:hypothetical protein [Actinomycetospora cinnamomea]|uniref:Uncharacterized protein n=1 Tax=Actinomycetospora cinnamomea TaxID=663609 RepID=A0A2U1F8U4_9PSEU|nr:hypothetical protein [Actinomycetospora cinnamomea]PVZ08601.1 hypothetical protein C8D89_108198 [Actinomycetospora cinnamomea]
MPAIPDEHVVRVLRPFVAATGPVLRGLRDADPFRLGRLARRRAIEVQDGAGDTERLPAPSTRRGRIGRAFRAARARVLDRLATSKLPGTPRWQAMSPEERDRWWVSRVGRFTSAVASIPGIGGALARRLPVSDILGLGAQGLVVCAIASEHGVDGRDEQVRLLAAVLFGRDVDPTRHGDPHGTDVEREAGDLSGGVGSGEHEEERGRLAALARAVWRMGRTLWGLQQELDRRPQGRTFWRVLANLPVVGALASYRSERSGLKRAARAAAAWVAREQGRRR